MPIIRRLRSSTTVRFGAAVAILVATVGLTTTASGAPNKSIRTMGTEDVHINSKIFADLRFSPGNTTVKSGSELTLSHDDKTDEPHTLTIVDQGEAPSDVEGIFSCGEPGTVCDEVFTTVGPQIVDESASQFINVSGGSGLDGRLDTLWLPADTSISVPVDAPSGTTLSFFCAIHAWMQGTIKVG